MSGRDPRASLPSVKAEVRIWSPGLPLQPFPRGGCFARHLRPGRKADAALLWGHFESRRVQVTEGGVLVASLGSAVCRRTGSNAEGWGRLPGGGGISG